MEYRSIGCTLGCTPWSKSSRAVSLSELILSWLFVANSVTVWLSDVTIVHVKIKCSSCSLSEDSGASVVVGDGDAAIVGTLGCGRHNNDSDGSLSVLVLDIEVLHHDGFVDEIRKNLTSLVRREVGRLEANIINIGDRLGLAPVIEQTFSIC